MAAAMVVLPKMSAPGVGDGLRLVDGDEGSAVVDPHELCVLEMIG